MTVEQIDQVIANLRAAHADIDRLVNSYAAFIRARDGLTLIPIDCIKQTAIEARSGLSMDRERALELIRDDLQGTQSAPPAVVPQLTFDPETTGVSNNISPLEAAREIKLRRGKTP